MNRKNHFSIHKRALSFKYAFRGISKAVATQHNLWIHLSVGTLVVLAAIFFQVTRNEWIILILTMALVIAAELFNTAIEWVVDLVSPEKHPLAGAAKDVAAGAVLILALAAAIVGLIIFSPYLMTYL